MKTLCTLLLLIPTLLSGQFTFHDPDESSGFLTNLAEADGGLVVLSRGDNRVLEFDGTNWTSFHTDDYGFSSVISNPRELFVDDQGDYWLLYTQFIDRFDGENVEQLTDENFGLSSNNTFDVTQDAADNYFFAHANGVGISRYDGENWTRRGEYTGAMAPLNTVFSADFLEYDPVNDCIWVYNGGDFLKIENDTVTEYTESSLGISFDLSVDYCRDMAVTPDGKVWFAITDGTLTDGGILTYDNENWEFMDDTNGLPVQAVRAICALGEDIYIGDPVEDKISRLANGSWTTFTDANSNWPSFYSGFFYEMISIGQNVYVATNGGVIQFEATPTSTSDPIGIDQAELLEVYPNPTRSVITIAPGGGERIKEVRIYNANGALLQAQSYYSERNSSIIMPEARGLYLVLAVLEDGSRRQVKVLKQ